MAALKLVFLAVAALSILGTCEAVCKVVPCKDSATKFSVQYSPCPVKAGGKLNVTASAIAPRNIGGVLYDAKLYYADDLETPVLEISGKADCSSAKKHGKLPFKCPVKRGEQLGVKDFILQIPKDVSVDSDSYMAVVDLYTMDEKPLLCANVYFDLETDEWAGLQSKNIL